MRVVTACPKFCDTWCRFYGRSKTQVEFAYRGDWLNLIRKLLTDLILGGTGQLRRPIVLL